MPGMALRGSYILFLIIPTVLQDRKHYLRITDGPSVDIYSENALNASSGESAANKTQTWGEFIVEQNLNQLWLHPKSFIHSASEGGCGGWEGPFQNGTF